MSQTFTQVAALKFILAATELECRKLGSPARVYAVQYHTALRNPRLRSSQSRENAIRVLDNMLISSGTVPPDPSPSWDNRRGALA